VSSSPTRACIIVAIARLQDCSSLLIDAFGFLRNVGFVAGESGLNADHRTAGMSFGVLGTAAFCRPQQS